ncbi:hypothetical protein N7488_004098 [Penicillium malachiteum]|nr:hypothetical protein N7488_004098 [Penicillium malachiteum]
MQFEVPPYKYKFYNLASSLSNISTFSTVTRLIPKANPLIVPSTSSLPGSLPRGADICNGLTAGLDLDPASAGVQLARDKKLFQALEKSVAYARNRAPLDLCVHVVLQADGWPQIKAGKTIREHAYCVVRLLKALGTYSEQDQVQRILDSLDAGLVRDLLPADETMSAFMKKLDTYDRIWRRQSAERGSHSNNPNFSSPSNPNPQGLRTNQQIPARKAKFTPSNQVYAQYRPASDQDPRIPPASTPQAPSRQLQIDNKPYYAKHANLAQRAWNAKRPWNRDWNQNQNRNFDRQNLANSSQPSAYGRSRAFNAEPECDDEDGVEDGYEQPSVEDEVDDNDQDMLPSITCGRSQDVMVGKDGSFVMGGIVDLCVYVAGREF